MLITDIEANGLLETVDKFHCAVTNDGVSDNYVKYRPDDFVKYLEALEAEVARGGILVLHNGIKYDVPALNKLSLMVRGKPFVVPWYQVIDTLVLTRLLFANIKDTDVVLLRQGKLPGKRFGSHALEAWGYRLGEMKGEYKTDFKKELEEQGETYEEGMEWRAFSEPMLDYNVQDVVVTRKLFEHCLSQSHYFIPENQKGTLEWERFWSGAQYALTLEHRAATVLAQMERNGFPVSEEQIKSLYVTLSGRRSELLVDLTNTFGSWYQPKGGKEPFRHPKSGRALTEWTVGPFAGKPIPRVVYPKAGAVFKKPKNKKQREGLEPCELDTRLYIEGCPYTPIEYVTFNPSSRDHIQYVLLKAGWQPTEKTKSGDWKVDDDILEKVELDDPKAQRCVDLIKEYLTIQKRIGQVAEGDNGWLRMIAPDGRIHGSVNPNGAVTGRATHSFPNVAQVPKGKHRKDGSTVYGSEGGYGSECREAFGAQHNTITKVIRGELVREPDPWIQVGVDASGLELRCLGHFMAPYDNGEYCDVILNGDIHTKNQLAAGLPTRDNAKTFIYGFLYGAGAAKIGEIVKGPAEDGKRLIASFLEQTPAIAALREGLTNTLVASSKWVGGEQKVQWKRRWVKGLDGRKVHVRSPHAALNTLLQSAGALICKMWVVELVRMLEEKGYKHGWDGDFALMAWVHDEVQVAARTQEIAEDVVRICQEAMRYVGEFFKFRCLLDTEGKIGGNWHECH